MFIQDFIAGWIAGTAALAVGHPFDTIKVRQQILHTNFFRAIRFTFRHEGIKGFYKGFIFPALMVGPSNAIFFGGYGNTMRYLHCNGSDARVDVDEPHWKMNVFLAGIFAGFWQAIITCPSEVVKTTLQMQTNHQGLWQSTYESNAKGLIDCVIKIWHGPGLRWYFRGLTPMLYRDLPTSGMYILTYEYLLHYDYGIKLQNHTLLKQVFAGGTAGLLSWVCVIPFDVLKSRMQGDNMNDPRFRSMYHCAVTTYQEYGFKYFLRGTWPVIIRAFPFNAVVFVMYELVMDVFKKLEKNM